MITNLLNDKILQNPISLAEVRIEPILPSWFGIILLTSPDKKKEKKKIHIRWLLYTVHNGFGNALQLTK